MEGNNMNYIMRTTTNRRNYHLALLHELYPPYWEEGINEYPRYRKGFKNPNKTIYSYQVRMYRTWKYNRLTQWK